MGDETILSDIMDQVTDSHFHDNIGQLQTFNGIVTSMTTLQRIWSQQGALQGLDLIIMIPYTSTILLTGHLLEEMTFNGTSPINDRVSMRPINDRVNLRPVSDRGSMRPITGRVNMRAINDRVVKVLCTSTKLRVITETSAPVD